MSAELWRLKKAGFSLALVVEPIVDVNPSVLIAKVLLSAMGGPVTLLERTLFFAAHVDVGWSDTVKTRFEDAGWSSVSGVAVVGGE